MKSIHCIDITEESVTLREAIIFSNEDKTYVQDEKKKRKKRRPVEIDDLTGYCRKVGFKVGLYVVGHPCCRFDMRK